MEEKMKKQDTQEDVQVKTEEELSQVVGGGATRRSPGKPIMPVNREKRSNESSERFRAPRVVGRTVGTSTAPGPEMELI